MRSHTDSPIIVALDFSSQDEAMKLIERLEPERCRLKVGKELFTRSGPQFVERLTKDGYDVFLDLKFHDIPTTVSRACRAAADIGVWMVNVHALGGMKMMQMARESLMQCSHPPLLVAVTILTSMGETDVAQIGLSGTPQEGVLRLAALAKESGLDGVVCSPQESPVLRHTYGDSLQLVTPGIRPAWSVVGEQIRITTPAEAVRNGSDYLVIGRPITAAEEPLMALAHIEQELLQYGHE